MSYEADDRCPLCDTKIRIDEVDATTDAAKIFMEVISDYEEIKKLNIRLHSRNPIGAESDFENELQQIKARFQHALEQLVIKKIESNNKILVNKKAVADLISFVENKRTIETEEDVGYISAQNQVAGIINRFV